MAEENTKVLLSAVCQAISIAENNAWKYNLDCVFSERTGYLFSTDEQQTKKLDETFHPKELVAMWDIVIQFQLISKRLWFLNVRCKFIQRNILFGLAKTFENPGGRILQQCRVTEVKEKDEKILEVNHTHKLHGWNTAEKI